MVVDDALAGARVSTVPAVTPVAWARGLDSFTKFLDEFSAGKCSQSATAFARETQPTIRAPELGKERAAEIKD
jgi:hypothetical protein